MFTRVKSVLTGVLAYKHFDMFCTLKAVPTMYDICVCALQTNTRKICLLLFVISLVNLIWIWFGRNELYFGLLFVKRETQITSDLNMT